MEINEHLLDIVHRVGEQITHQEGRERKRKAEAQKHFLFGIEHLLVQLWKGTQILEGFEGGINKRAGWYSEHPQYRDPRLTYKQTIAAYDGLIGLGLIHETQRGHFSHETLEGNITRFAATDELLIIDDVRSFFICGTAIFVANAMESKFNLNVASKFLRDTLSTPRTPTPPPALLNKQWI